MYNHDDIIYWDEWSRERQEALREQLARDPELAARWRAWSHLLDSLRHHLDTELGDRRILIYDALQQAGYEHLLTPEEKETLQANRKYLEQLSHRLASFSEIRQALQEDVQTFQKLWEVHAPATSFPRYRQQRQRLPLRLWHLVALSVVVFTAIVTWNYVRYRQGFVEVTATERQALHLPDGSEAILHPGTRLAYHPAYPRRVRLLKGKALFDVQSRPSSSFVVQTPVAFVTVTGTTFGVETSPSHTRVVLAQGRVLVSSRRNPEASVVLEPGQFTEVEAQRPPTLPRPADITEELLWTGRLFFYRTPLTSLLRTLETRYQIRILVDEHLAQEYVTATLEAEQPVDEILKALALTLGARVEQIDAHTYRLMAES